MSSDVISNRDRDSYIKRYNDCTSIICRPPSVITVEHLDSHSDKAQVLINLSKKNDQSSDSSILNHQAPDYNAIFDDDFYEFREDDDDDDGSSISSILEAFTNTLATPPSVSWDYETGQFASFDHPPIFSSSLSVKRKEDQRSLKRRSFVSELTPRSSICYPTLTTCPPASSLNTSSHRANKSLPNHISHSISLPLLTHQISNKRSVDQISMTIGPKSRTSDLSTCATLVSTSPIRSTFECNTSYSGGGYTIPNKFGEYRDQIQTYGFSTPSSPGFSAEGEKSSWESDDDDDDTDTVNNESSFADLVLGWPRFSRIQIHDIKRKLRIRKSGPVHENDNIKQSNGKWHEAMRKSTERKKKVSYVLRGFLRLKVPTLE
ncbi:hypothetical protein OnM2_064058 [Erysiphe neolycopersici]|uniref:Uncharacterized protein n=1 Tax=Erysiphe neolycopersici TaxID=212602 RepID=A0A420HNF0_9PEZI|nr:hypothetical protein OnM2_064058 [Erysiphe neolycopersici]